MEYFILTAFLFIIELAYFRIANAFNIIDQPNERSAHSKITIRGGGIIFYIGILCYFVYTGFQHPWFFLALTLMSFISFRDDLSPVSIKVRLIIHLISVLILFFEVGLFDYPWWIVLTALIVAIGMINAYNFMDGINGITALYSIIVLILFALTNIKYGFINNYIIHFSLIAAIVFGFFNFRNNAKCFAGDIGSVGMAFILLFLTLALILKTGNLFFILFFVVYGIDTVWTIIHRILKKENVFEAHRTHLYQYLSNESGYNQLYIAAIYSLIQLSIGFLVLFIVETKGINFQIYFAVILVFFLSAIYLAFKRKIVKDLKKKN